MGELDALITHYLGLARTLSTESGYKTAWRHWKRYILVVSGCVEYLAVLRRGSKLGVHKSLQFQRYVTYLARKGLKAAHPETW